VVDGDEHAERVAVDDDLGPHGDRHVAGPEARRRPAVLVAGGVETYGAAGRADDMRGGDDAGDHQATTSIMTVTATEQFPGNAGIVTDLPVKSSRHRQ